ncbi:MAG: helix-turn-helix transcriptional regulator [Oscillospiraceae bacterium]|nr:helix-turn-helix transcriptional regulator [Oscillospiraceae bacterium]MBQ4544483.1 helix-turn-helix transcriptional regulator [Oscillospiraceae bacterium]MBQ6902262.1 helix-turn-helix transcriptional regulator [Oscillospiraceae bacterium]
MKKQNNLLLGKLHTVDFPKEFPVTYYFCEKKYKTAEDMQFHNHFEFGLCLEGQGIFFIGNKMIPFAQGNVSIIPPGTPHFAQSLNSHPSRWMFVSFELSVPSHVPEDISPSIVYDSAIEQMLKLISEELEKKKCGYEAAVSHLLDVLFIRAQRLDIDAQILFNYGDGLSAVYPAIEYISQHYPDDITVEALSSMCRMSLTNFRRRFASVTGMTPLRYILAMRLRMASVLLRVSDRKISDIALDVGYNTLSSFNRHFRESYNMSPRDYRLNLQAEDNDGSPLK